MASRQDSEVKAGDRWGRDPAVARLRKIFALMEERQQDWLVRNRVKEWDPRLGTARLQARHRLEQGWRRVLEQGLEGDAEQLAGFYLQGLARALKEQGLEVVIPVTDFKEGT